MAVDAKHPDYERFQDNWNMMRDCSEGEFTIKDKGQEYLTMPSGFTTQQDQGVASYNGYRARAQYPEILVPTLQGMVGVIHRVEAEIEGLEEGKPLASMWEKATKDGLTLEAFHRRITSELLLMGRYEILTDVSSEGDGLPYLVGYSTELLINWADIDRNMFVLDESRKVQGVADEFSWTDKKQYLVLRLQGDVYTQQIYDENTQSGEIITPQQRGATPLKEIPLVIVGPRDLSMDMEPPPLVGVAKASLAIYRLDADYRHQLFNSGQETLFIMSESDTVPKTVGSGVIIGLPLGSDAKYVGPNCAGINAHRTAIADERQGAVAAGVKLFDGEKQAESGDALRLRASAQTATLTTIAQASAAALERSLRYAAMFVGQDPKEIIVKPNLAFIDTKMAPQDFWYLVQSWQAGAFSKETLYENAQRGEIASSERTFEEEQELIDQELLDQPLPPEEMTARPGAQQQQIGVQRQRQGGGRLNGSSALQGEGDMSRFIETGEGLQIESAA